MPKESKIMTVSALQVLTTKSAFDILVSESIEHLSNHYGVTVEETKAAFLAGAENVQSRVMELVFKAAQATADKMNESA